MEHEKVRVYGRVINKWFDDLFYKIGGIMEW